jgi:hypothetical protein
MGARGRREVGVLTRLAPYERRLARLAAARRGTSLAGMIRGFLKREVRGMEEEGMHRGFTDVWELLAWGVWRSRHVGVGEEPDGEFWRWHKAQVRRISENEQAEGPCLPDCGLEHRDGGREL